MRITRTELYLTIAQLISKRGTCRRLQVGAVLTVDNRIISTGYNGPKKDEPHCNDFDCDISKPCNRAVHAEVNAINGSWHTELIGTKRLYVTHQPCLGCAKAIVEAGISEVYYRFSYRDQSGLEYLKSSNIKLFNEEA